MLSFWVLSKFEFLSFVPIWVCLVLSQFEFVLTKKKLWILTWFIFHFHKIAWKLCFCWIFIRLVLDLLQEPAPALDVDCWITTVFWKQGYWIITPWKLKNVIIHWHANDVIICWPKNIKRIFCPKFLKASEAH